MTNVKYIGLDVHQATIAAAVLDANGKLVMESVLETRASTILDFIRGVGGQLNITFEEGISAEWLHGVLKSDVDKIVVCDPRKNALLKAGNKRSQQIVEPASRGSFLESNGQRSAQSGEKLQDGGGFRFQDAFHAQLARLI